MLSGTLAGMLEIVRRPALTSRNPRARLPAILAACAIASAIVPHLKADDRVQSMIDGLAREAAAFEKIAPELAAVETQRQQVLKPPKFKLRIGDTAKDPVPEFTEKEITSEFALTEVGGTLHEIRQVIRVDGKPVQQEKHAEEELARSITQAGDEARRESMRQLEKYGLRGGVTDVSTVLLMFKPGLVEHYEITGVGPRMSDTTQTYVFRFKQIDGSGGMTVFDGTGAPRRLKVEGEIWSRVSDWAPLRIIVTATDGEAEKALREETSVQYQMSAFHVLVPTLVRHRELRGGKPSADHTFLYTEFHRIKGDR